MRWFYILAFIVFIVGIICLEHFLEKKADTVTAAMRNIFRRHPRK